MLLASSSGRHRDSRGCPAGLDPGTGDRRGATSRAAPALDRVVGDDRSVAGEVAAFVATRTSALHRLAFLLTGDRGAAEDLLQEALVQVVAHWERVSRVEDPDAYVRRVLVNQHLQGRRRLRWRAEVLTSAPPERPDAVDSEGRVDDADALHRVLGQLPPRQRAVVVLRYDEGLSERETAQVLDCSVGTVKSSASRGLAALRHLLDVADECGDERPIPRLEGESMTYVTAPVVAWSAR